MSKDTRRAFNRLSEKMALEMGLEFKLLFEQAMSLLTPQSMRKLSNAIRAQDFGVVIALLKLKESALDVLYERIRTGVLAGGAYQLGKTPKSIRHPETGARIAIRFGGSQPRAQAIVKQLGGRLISGIVQAQIEIITSIISEGLEAGLHSDAIALDLVGRKDAGNRRRGGVLGLTSSQSKTVQSVRVGFRSGNTKRMQSYLTLKGRNKRFDHIVHKAIGAGVSVAKSDIDRITGNLADKYLLNRGKMIARTEMIAALNAGRREGALQLVDDGVVAKNNIQRVWNSTLDARNRDDHVAMHNQKVGLDDPFIAPDGSKLMSPADSGLGASAAQIINCRCYMSVEVDWLAGVG